MCGYLCIGFIDFMLAWKILTDYAALFSRYEFFLILKMHEIDKTKLSDQTKYRLYKIKKKWELFYQWDQWKRIIQ